jgi:hypothetical protein
MKTFTVTVRTRTCCITYHAIGADSGLIATAAAELVDEPCGVTVIALQEETC